MNREERVPQGERVGMHPHAQRFAPAFPTDVPPVMAVGDIDHWRSLKADAIGERVFGVGHAAAAAVVVEDGRQQFGLCGHQIAEGHLPATVVEVIDGKDHRQQ